MVFVAGYWLLDLIVLRAGVPAPLDDTWEYGVAARHLLAGAGFRTSVIPPPLWPLRDASLTVPLLIHGPLFPLLLAPLIAAFGPATLDHVAWIGALAACLTAVPLYRLGERALVAPVGAAAVLLLTLSPLTLEAVNHDPSLCVGGLLLMLALELATRPRPAAGRAGLALGAAGLARPEMALVLPVLLVLIGRGARVRGALAALACLLPWWWYQGRAAGIPGFNLSSYLLIAYTERYPELSPLRDFALTPERWPRVLAGSLPWLWRKWLFTLPRAVKHALCAPSGGTGWLGLPGALAILARPRLRSLATAALVIGLIPIGLMVTTEHSPRYVTPFLGLWSLASACGAEALLRRLPVWAHRPRTLILALLLLILPSTGPALRESFHDTRVLESWLALERSRLASKTAGMGARAAPMFSDTPDLVAWTTGRPTVWVTRAEYERLYAHFPQGARPDLPPAPKPGELWFHADPHNPERSAGGH